MLTSHLGGSLQTVFFQEPDGHFVSSLQLSIRSFAHV